MTTISTGKFLSLEHAGTIALKLLALRVKRREDFRIDKDLAEQIRRVAKRANVNIEKVREFVANTLVHEAVASHMGGTHEIFVPGPNNLSQLDRQIIALAWLQQGAVEDGLDIGPHSKRRIAEMAMDTEESPTLIKDFYVGYILPAVLDRYVGDETWEVRRTIPDPTE